MKDAAELNSEFQLAIPRELAARMGWKPGQLFAFEARADKLLVGPAKAEPAAQSQQVNPIQALGGLMAGRTVEEFVRDRNDRY